MFFFCYRYWYPLTHFLSLAFTPTCIVGLNVGLDMPRIEFRSNARPSTFAYPPPLEEKKDKSKEKVETAVLSTTARQKRKEAEKKKEEKMEVVSIFNGYVNCFRPMLFSLRCAFHALRILYLPNVLCMFSECFRFFKNILHCIESHWCDIMPQLFTLNAIASRHENNTIFTNDTKIEAPKSYFYFYTLYFGLSFVEALQKMQCKNSV
jgi:hypothetical protein